MSRNIFMLAVAALICSCSFNGNRLERNNGIVIDSIVRDSSYALANTPNSPKCEVSLHLKYIKGIKNAEEINQELIRSGLLSPDYITLTNKKINIKFAVDSFINKYISDYKRDFGEMYRDEIDKENCASYNYLYMVKTDISTCGDIITYIATIYNYTGGAHGMEQTLAKNFDLKKNKLLTLNDVFIHGYEQTIKDIITKELLNKFKVKDLNSLKEQYIFSDVNVYIPDNFIIGKDNITFIYCEDEIAPHAVGEIRIDISKSDVKSLLKE